MANNMIKTITGVSIGILVAIGIFLYVRMEVREHRTLNQVVQFLNQSIQKSQALPTNAQ